MCEGESWVFQKLSLKGRSYLSLNNAITLMSHSSLKCLDSFVFQGLEIHFLVSLKEMQWVSLQRSFFFDIVLIIKCYLVLKMDTCHDLPVIQFLISWIHKRVLLLYLLFKRSKFKVYKQNFNIKTYLCFKQVKQSYLNKRVGISPCLLRSKRGR